MSYVHISAAFLCSMRPELEEIRGNMLRLAEANWLHLKLRNMQIQSDTYIICIRILPTCYTACPVHIGTRCISGNYTVYTRMTPTQCQHLIRVFWYSALFALVVLKYLWRKTVQVCNYLISLVVQSQITWYCHYRLMSLCLNARLVEKHMKLRESPAHSCNCCMCTWYNGHESTNESMNVSMNASESINEFVRF